MGKRERGRQEGHRGSTLERREWEKGEGEGERETISAVREYVREE